MSRQKRSAANATMAFTRFAGGGWVFATGNMLFEHWLGGGSSGGPQAQRMLDNLWTDAAPTPPIEVPTTVTG